MAHASSVANDPHVLLTKKSLALSLSAPRAPPVGSEPHRALVASSHPHLPTNNLEGTATTRRLGSWWNLVSQNRFRDSGGFRRLADGLVTVSAPLLPLSHPSSIPAYIRLSSQLDRIPYGPHSRHYVDVYKPQTNEFNRIIFFIHGGAWGSGEPWMYRLVADCFLRQGFLVAIPCYRTYPDGEINHQVEDCQEALQLIVSRFSRFPITVLGHSSGAHVGLMMLVAMAQEK